MKCHFHCPTLFFRKNLITKNRGLQIKIPPAKCQKPIPGKSPSPQKSLTKRKTQFALTTIFSDEENDPKNENVTNDDKATKDDGKSSPEGHRSTGSRQKHLIAKTDHDNTPCMQ